MWTHCDTVKAVVLTIFLAVFFAFMVRGVHLDSTCQQRAEEQGFSEFRSLMNGDCYGYNLTRVH